MKAQVLPYALGVCALVGCASEVVHRGATADDASRDDVVVTIRREDAPAGRDAMDDGREGGQAPPSEDVLQRVPDATRDEGAASGGDVPSNAGAAPDAAADSLDATEVIDASAVVDATDASEAPDVPDVGDVFADTADGDVRGVDGSASDGGTSECTLGVELPVVVRGATAEGNSLATSGDRHAVTWTTTGPWAPEGAPVATWLAVLDADGRTIGAPRRVDQGSRVVALEGGFGLATSSGLAILDRDGRERARGGAPGVFGLTREGDRLYGTISAGDGGGDRRVVSLAATGMGPVLETPMVVPTGFTPIAYGPSRVLAATHGYTLVDPQRFLEVAQDGGASVVRFERRWSDGPTYVMGSFWDATMSVWVIVGLRHLPMSREGLVHTWTATESGTLRSLGPGVTPPTRIYLWPSASVAHGARGDFMASCYTNDNSVMVARGSPTAAASIQATFGLSYGAGLSSTWSDTLGRYTILYGVDGSLPSPARRLAVRCVR